MLNAFLTFAVQVALLLLGIWITFALLGLKWHFFRPLRHGYSNLIKTVAIVAANWLWISPQVKREGGGKIVQPQVPSEEESWDMDFDNDAWQ